MEICIPYGKGDLKFELPDSIPVDIITPRQVNAHIAPEQAVLEALEQPQGYFRWERFRHAKTAAIAINDKTRPVPHDILLSPLLGKLKDLGIAAENIVILIATGAHLPMTADEFHKVVPPEILESYTVLSHNCDSKENLKYVGKTQRGTPVWVNARFYQADLKIVVGNIEPHQFQGFSGGAKSAAIGLAGRESINHNHALMTDPNARLAKYDANPARQDVEEMGKLIGVDLALNAVLNPNKEIVYALAGEPVAVMQAGIPLSQQICQVAVQHMYELMIVSPGGHPKDINVYQSQKGLAHAARITRPGGTIILAAACGEGSGSPHYEDWVMGKKSSEDVMRQFEIEGFCIGPHKAFQIARDSLNVCVCLYSHLDDSLAQSLLFNPVNDFQTSVHSALADLPPGEKIGILPYAASTIPFLG